MEIEIVFPKTNINLRNTLATSQGPAWTAVATQLWTTIWRSITLSSFMAELSFNSWASISSVATSIGVRITSRVSSFTTLILVLTKGK